MTWLDLTSAERAEWTGEAFAGMAEFLAKMNDTPADAGEGENE